MDYGKDMQSYILMEIWPTQSTIVTILKIGFLRRLQGPILPFIILISYMIILMLVVYLQWKILVLISKLKSNWYFNCRKKDNATYEATTWQIKFKLDNVNASATYKLRLALASAHASNLQVMKRSIISSYVPVSSFFMKIIDFFF